MNEKWAKKTDITFREIVTALGHVKKEKVKNARGKFVKAEEKVAEKTPEKEEKKDDAADGKDDDTRSPE
jgi:hypothetical protein